MPNSSPHSEPLPPLSMSTNTLYGCMLCGAFAYSPPIVHRPEHIGADPNQYEMFKVEPQALQLWQVEFEEFDGPREARAEMVRLVEQLGALQVAVDDALTIFAGTSWEEAFRDLGSKSGSIDYEEMGWRRPASDPAKDRDAQGGHTPTVAPGAEGGSAHLPSASIPAKERP